MSLCVCKFPFQVPFRQRFMAWVVLNILLESLFVHLFISSRFKGRHSPCTTRSVSLCVCVHLHKAFIFAYLTLMSTSHTTHCTKCYLYFGYQPRLKTNIRQKAIFLTRPACETDGTVVLVSNNKSEKNDCVNIYARIAFAPTPNQRRQGKKMHANEKLCIIGNLKPVT